MSVSRLRMKARWWMSLPKKHLLLKCWNLLRCLWRSMRLWRNQMHPMSSPESRQKTWAIGGDRVHGGWQLGFWALPWEVWGLWDERGGSVRFGMGSCVLSDSGSELTGMLRTGNERTRTILLPYDSSFWLRVQFSREHLCKYEIIAKVMRWRRVKGRWGSLDMLDAAKEADIYLRPQLVNWEACAGHRMSPLRIRIHLSYSITMRWCRDSLTVGDRMSR